MSAPGTESVRPQGSKADKSAGSDRRPLGQGHVSGNLTFDPELRFTPTGRAVCKLRIAYVPRVKDADSGNWIDGEVEFYDIDAWGQQAENCAEKLRKGDRVVAIGDWQEVTYESKDGSTVTRNQMTARDIGPSLLFRAATIDRTDRTGGKA